MLLFPAFLCGLDFFLVNSPENSKNFRVFLCVCVLCLCSGFGFVSKKCGFPALHTRLGWYSSCVWEKSIAFCQLACMEPPSDEMMMVVWCGAVVWWCVCVLLRLQGCVAGVLLLKTTLSFWKANVSWWADLAQFKCPEKEYRVVDTVDKACAYRKWVFILEHSLILKCCSIAVIFSWITLVHFCLQEIYWESLNHLIIPISYNWFWRNVKCL